MLAVHHHLRSAAAAVVVGAHAETVGTGSEHGQQVAGGEVELALLAEEVRGFTHRAHHIPRRLLALRVWPHRLDVHPGLVQGRPQQVVHARVHQREVVLWRGLEVLHSGQHQARIGGNGAAGLEHQAQLAVTDLPADRGDIVRYRRWCLVLVGDAEATPQIEVADRDAFCRELVNQRQQAAQGVCEGAQSGQL